MAGASFYDTRAGQLGLTLRSASRVDNVTAVLLAGGSDCYNLRVTTVAAVPEPPAAALWLAGLSACVAAARRRRQGA